MPDDGDHGRNRREKRFFCRFDVVAGPPRKELSECLTLKIQPASPRRTRRHADQGHDPHPEDRAPGPPNMSAAATPNTCYRIHARPARSRRPEGEMPPSAPCA